MLQWSVQTDQCSRKLQCKVWDKLLYNLQLLYQNHTHSRWKTIAENQWEREIQSLCMMCYKALCPATTHEWETTVWSFLHSVSITSVLHIIPAFKLMFDMKAASSCERSLKDIIIQSLMFYLMSWQHRDIQLPISTQPVFLRMNMDFSTNIPSLAAENILCALHPFLTCTIHASALTSPATVLVYICNISKYPAKLKS